MEKGEMVIVYRVSFSRTLCRSQEVEEDKLESL